MNYRDFLQREFESRSRRNPAYSLRAYARDLGVQPSKLSEGLRGLKGFSRATAQRIARGLELSSPEQEYFVTLVEQEHARGQAAKKSATEKLRSLEAQRNYKNIYLDHFKAMADWYHLAILELTAVKDFTSDSQWIAARLGIHEREAENALQRLLELGMLVRDSTGALRQAEEDAATPGDIPSKAIREHHSQILAKADAALERVPVERREYSSTTMAIDPARISEAKEWLREFRRRFCRDLQSGGEKSSVYCLSIQLFPLDKQERPL